MDALSEVLRVLHLNTGIFLEAEFTAPWCVESAAGSADLQHVLPDAEHVAIYHLVTEGRCHARLDGTRDHVPLETGDLVLFPHADGHVLGSQLGMAAVSSTSLVEPGPQGGLMQIRHGGGGDITRLICGFLACDKRLCRPLLDALPRIIRVTLSDDPSTQWMVGAIRHGASETHSPQPGTAAVMGRLAELLFVEALRKYIKTLPEDQLGWLAGLRDPFVGRALAHLHARPAHAWEVEELAREAGLSRSALADRFVALIGEPPMQYLARWRLALAAQALSKTNDAVARVASDVGYESEAAFNRAFKREYGQPPAQWRRNQRSLRAVQPVAAE